MTRAPATLATPAMAAATRQLSPVGGRACNGCTLCCKLLSIEELEKPPALTCRHCTTGTGCGIYADRPTECRGFFCDYLLDPALGEEWQPARSGMVVAFEDYSNAIVIHVDDATPLVWQAEPFASQIRAWATAGSGANTQVIVWQGDTKIVIAPAPQSVAEAV